MAFLSKQDAYVSGSLVISDPDTEEVFVTKNNAVHYENMSVAMATSMINPAAGISRMAFGSGGTVVDPTGLIAYLTPNTVGVNCSLYNQTYFKIIDANNSQNLNPLQNKMEIRHISGATYTDILITCLLDYGEPADQEAFDNSVDLNGDFIFDELGIQATYPDDSIKLLTHVVFHPVQKALNRRMQIDYTIRIQSLTGSTEVSQ